MPYDQPVKRPQNYGRVWSAWREHWPEYLIESWGLGTFMISATVASAASANVWTSLWIYFAAPIGAMLLAAEVYLRWKGADRVFCAKLNHYGRARCIFHCRFHELAAHRG